MLNQDVKLKNFLDAINHEAQENYDRILSEIEELSREELLETRTSAEKEANEFYNRAVSKNKAHSNGVISSARLSIRKKLCEKRNNITEDVFRSAREKLAEFTKSEEYKTFLQKSAEALKEELSAGAELFVREEDMKYADMIKEAYGENCSVSADDDIVIGGIKGKDADSSLMADDTLDGRLNSQYQWFLSSCEMSINV